MLYPILGIVACVPLPLASNRVSAAAVLSILVVGLSIKALYAGYLRGRVPGPLSIARVPIFCFLLYVALLVAQLALTATELGTVDPFHTRQQLLWTLTYVCIFVLIVLVVRDTASQRLLAWVLVVSGVMQAFVGILLHSQGATYTVFFFEVNHAERVLGSFSYHNSMANYMLMCMALGVGLLLGESGESLGRLDTQRQRLRWLLEFLLSPRMVLRLGLVVMLIALVLTRSRMANFALPAALLVVGFPLLIRAGGLRWLGALLVASVLLVDLLVIGNWIGLDRVVKRISETALTSEPGRHEESIEARSVAAADAVAMVRARPWLGHGAGTFYAAFPRFAGEDVRRFYDHAHNDYMQFAAETGLLGLALLSLIVLVSLWRALGVLQAPRTAIEGGLAFGVLVAVPAVLLQATVDFHFQIPANALTFVVLLALVWTLRLRSPRE